LECSCSSPTLEVTLLLKAWREGDDAALDALMPLVDDERRRIARRCLRGERTEHSVHATESVNEAFLRLIAVCTARPSQCGTSPEKRVLGRAPH